MIIELQQLHILSAGAFNVGFIINISGVRLINTFYSEYYKKYK